MKNIIELPKEKIEYLFTDIDDTLTLHGKLPANSYKSLWELYNHGIKIIPITGRPAGWCEMIARMWPVHGIIGENGAFYFSYQNKKMKRKFALDEKLIQTNRKKLDELSVKVLNEVPGTALASDQFTRLMDIAIDFCEDVAPLNNFEIQKIVDICESAGTTAKVSSIHVNAWYGSYDKLSMCKSYCENEFNFELNKYQDKICFIGDSPNDEPMFSYFENSVAVSNIQAFLDQLQYKPKFICPSEGANGFVELACHILK